MGKEDQDECHGSFDVEEGGSIFSYGSGSVNIDSLVKVANMVSPMKDFEFRNTGTSYLTKRVGLKNGGNGKIGSDFEDLVENAMGSRYEFGDMVWGKIKSYPCWPGQIFHEALAVTDARETKIEGHVLVAFFGDNSYGWLHPMQLVPFDSNYVTKSKQSNLKGFVNAVEQAGLEVSRRAALGLWCQCRNPSNLRSTCVEEVLAVDVHGFAPDGLYTMKQIKEARARFQTTEMLHFIKQSALMPPVKFQRTVHWIKNVATVIAYRKVVFEECDLANIESFGAHPSFPVKSLVAFNRMNKVPLQTKETDETSMEVTGALPAYPASPRISLTQPVKPKKLMRQGTARISCQESAKDLPSASKSPKKRLKQVDNANIGWNNSSKLYKEDFSSKGLGKLNELMPQSTEKKFGNGRPLNSLDKGKKETEVKAPLKPVKKSFKKLGTRTKSANPTSLLMQFPPQAMMPSVSELKAKFENFGPFQNSPRVFWKSSTCRIVFKYEADAQVARRYAVQNRSLFGNVKVLYDVQVLQLPALVTPRPSKYSLEEPTSSVPKLTPNNSCSSTEPSLKAQEEQQQLTPIYHESCLKEQQTNGTWEGGNEKEQSAGDMFVKTLIHNQPSDTSFVPERDKKNFERNVPPLPPWLPLSYWITNVIENDEIYQIVEVCNQKFLQAERKNNSMRSATQTPDVSAAILDLLMRCNAIVADLKSSLGYVPYHLP